MTNIPLAEFVFDGTRLVVPEAMGEPKDGQLVGTLYERFGEICGRVCYDSLGKGRPSAEYHKHICDIKHYNVYEGCVATWIVDFKSKEDLFHTAIALGNRPGVWFVVEEDRLRVTLNARAAIEWKRHTMQPNEYSQQLGMLLVHEWSKLMPAVFGEVPELRHPSCPFQLAKTEPKYNHEKWVSLWLYLNRGGSHEQVRHRWMGHMSQRSTRFCDESASPRVEHPMLRAYCEDTGDDIGYLDGHPAQHYTGLIYRDAVTKLQPWLESQGYDKTTARKQARGAAREYLEHQLSTQMIYGGSVTAWDWMIHERASKWADGHIQELYVHEVVPALLDSVYADSFSERGSELGI